MKSLKNYSQKMLRNTQFSTTQTKEFMFQNHTELEASLSGGQGVHRVSLGKVQIEHLPSSVGQES